MKLGAMNSPARELESEIHWIGQNRFDFIDLTLEAPKALPQDVDPSLIAELCGRYGLEIVGHTSPFMPIGSVSQAVREACLREHLRCLDVFAQVGVRKVTLHVSQYRGAESAEENIRNNIWSFQRFAEAALERGMTPMLEHFGEAYNKVETLARFFEAVPGLLFHLDVGHANLWGARNCTDELLTAFASRLGHVHVSDNVGGKDDLHLPLGAGNIKWRRIVNLLKQHGYDDTITVEVFSGDRAYLLYSRARLRALWEGIDTATAPPEEEF
ncbi:MAG: sugar phosphate isomerase/epimerase family protein [Armatimonadota bacterium]